VYTQIHQWAIIERSNVSSPPFAVRRCAYDSQESNEISRFTVRGCVDLRTAIGNAAAAASATDGTVRIAELPVTSAHVNEAPGGLGVRMGSTRWARAFKEIRGALTQRTRRNCACRARAIAAERCSRDAITRRRKIIDRP